MMDFFWGLLFGFHIYFIDIIHGHFLYFLSFVRMFFYLALG